MRLPKSIEAESVLEAIAQYLQAKARQEQEFRRFQEEGGYGDWGYYGEEYYTSVCEAVQKFDDAMEAYLKSKGQP